MEVNCCGLSVFCIFYYDHHVSSGGVIGVVFCHRFPVGQVQGTIGGKFPVFVSRDVGLMMFTMRAFPVV